MLVKINLLFGVIFIQYSTPYLTCFQIQDTSVILKISVTISHQFN